MKCSTLLIIDDSHKITGIVSDVGDWIGDKRTKYYSRAEFKTTLILQEKLRFAKKKLELQVKDVDFEEYTLENLSLDRVVLEINKCLNHLE
jgi:hypothetical protein